MGGENILKFRKLLIVLSCLFVLLSCIGMSFAANSDNISSTDVSVYNSSVGFDNASNHGSTNGVLDYGSSNVSTYAANCDSNNALNSDSKSEDSLISNNSNKSLVSSSNSFIQKDNELTGDKSVYISSNGSDDAGDGSELSPFKTFDKGFDYCRNHNIKTIYVEGTYYGEIWVSLDDLTIIGINNPVISGGKTSRGLTNYASNLTIKGFTFKDCYKRIGASIFDSGGITVINCTFIDNYAWGAGGAIYAPSEYFKVINSTFISNVAYQGAAIYGEYGASIINSTFVNNGNASTSQGGAVFMYGDNLYVENCSFVNNTANYVGGAFITYSAGNVTCINSSFINNSAKVAGGAIISDGESNYINNCTFINNSALNYGGAVSLFSGNVSNSRFINNTCELGSAICSNNLQVSNVSVINPRSNGSDIVVLSYGVINDTNSSVVKVYNYPIMDGTLYNETSDGYIGFCAEKHNHEPYYGSYSISLDGIKNNLNGAYVGEYVKLLIYHNLNQSSNLNSTDIKLIQQWIWDFTDTNFLESNDTVIQDTIRRYNDGERIPSVSAKVLDNGTVLNYLFRSSFSANNYQNMFMFKILSGVDNITVLKDTLDSNVVVGDLVRFNITVRNDGNLTLDDVFINDSDYDAGLNYYDYVNGTGLWDYEGNHIWVLTSPLNPGESRNIILLFNTTKEGVLNNNVSAGYLNKTLSYAVNNTTVSHQNTTNTTNNTNNTTNNKRNNSTNNTTNNTPKSDNNTTNSTPQVNSNNRDKGFMYNTGNPLFILIITLVLLLFGGFKGNNKK
ncbi:MAG: hypothetical protein PUC09_00125 [Methanobrevibacter wolinii]|nr:hypothetical protein [Methanobrevibacter wolinii]